MRKNENIRKKKKQQKKQQHKNTHKNTNPTPQNDG